MDWLFATVRFVGSLAGPSLAGRAPQPAANGGSAKASASNAIAFRRLR